MNIQIFGTTKCFDTKKAQRYFKERGIKFQMIDLKEKEMSRASLKMCPALWAAGRRWWTPTPRTSRPSLCWTHW